MRWRKTKDIGNIGVDESGRTYMDVEVGRWQKLEMDRCRHRCGLMIMADEPMCNSQ